MVEVRLKRMPLIRRPRRVSHQGRWKWLLNWECGSIILLALPWYCFIKLFLEIQNRYISVALFSICIFLFSKMHHKAIIFLFCLFTCVDVCIFFTSPYYEIIFYPIEKI